ncbi:MAG: pyruvate formate lyase family protein, partial [Armatimonadota bacterium]
MPADRAQDRSIPALHPATERVERLREAALDRGDAQQDHNWRMVSFERDLYAGESLVETAGDRFWVRRRGHAIANILRNATVSIGPDELLVGRPYLAEPSGDEAQRLEKAREYLAAQPSAFGQTGHQAVDIPRLLNLGARGIQAEVRIRRDALDPTDPENLPKIAFYDAAEAALDGLCEYAAHYARQAERLAAKTDDPNRRQELEEIAERCRRVPAHPARTFAEALQAVNFVNSTLHWAQGAHLVCPGHPDRWLWPYYERDTAEGRITPAQAQELLDCFNILINETVGRGLAIGTMIGGRDKTGADVTNTVSYMCLQSVRNVRLSYPGLGICWHPETPDSLLDFGCEVLSEMGANPAIFNDEVITQGLMNAGVAPEEACE